MGWHVAATCHLRKLFIFWCISGRTYIYVPICVHTIKIHELLNKIISLKGSGSQFDTGTVLNFCLMGLGCPLLLGSSVRGLRRCAATLPRLLERTSPGLSSFSVLLEVMAVVRDLEEGNISFLVHRLSGMCRRQWSCRMSPNC